MVLYYSWIIFIGTKILIFLQNSINYVEENLTLASFWRVYTLPGHSADRTQLSD